MTRPVLVCVLALAAACGGEPVDDAGGHGHGHEHAHHAHAAPHDGALVVLGEELAHVEVLVDEMSGEVRAWVLDGSAAAAVRVAQPELVLRVHPDAEAPVEVRLAALASELTGETVGDTSEFAGASPDLVGADRFEAEIVSIDVRGAAFERVRFGYPEGNE